MTEKSKILDLTNIEDYGVVWEALSRYERDMRRQAAAVSATDPDHAIDSAEGARRAAALLNIIGVWETDQ